MNRRIARASFTFTTSAALAIAGTLAVSAPAEATYYSGGMPKRSFSVKTVGINSEWVKYFDTARGNWNNAGVGASIKRKSSAKPSFTAGNYNQSWYGLHAPSGSRPNRSFQIKVNAKTLWRDTGNIPKYDKWVRSTSTHELGHALSLADNPNTSKASLMKHSRDRSKIQKPQPYDKSGGEEDLPMNVRRNILVTGTAMLAAFAAVGCSADGSTNGADSPATSDTVTYHADYLAYAPARRRHQEVRIAVVEGTVVGSRVQKVLPDAPAGDDPATNPQAGLSPAEGQGGQEGGRGEPGHRHRLQGEGHPDARREGGRRRHHRGQPARWHVQGVSYKETDTTMLAKGGSKYVLMLAAHGKSPYDLAQPGAGALHGQGGRHGQGRVGRRLHGRRQGRPTGRQGQPDRQEPLITPRVPHRPVRHGIVRGAPAPSHRFHGASRSASRTRGLSATLLPCAATAVPSSTSYQPCVVFTRT
ncbi:hypothetical protein LT493_21600 [Streptomyces tricolor]|nr:hypothetical protein [Streptomyces tricolor]